MTKSELRKQIKTRLNAMTTDQRALWSDQIRQRVLALPEIQKAHRIMLYYAMPTEADTLGLMNDLCGMGKYVYLPRVIGAGHMVLVRYLPDMPMLKGAYGICEPEGDPSGDIPDFVLTPGVAFDRWGARLGHGAGYYDRFLSQMHVPAAGLAFELQMTDCVAQEETDVRLDMVITQNAVYRSGKEMEL